MFVDIPWENPDQITREMILGNISQYCPDPRHRGRFIEAFYDLFNYFRLETKRYLGPRYAAEATAKIKTEMKNVLRYAKETPLRGHLLETFDKLAN